MIVGHVSASGHPILRIMVRGSGDIAGEFDAIVDTGFNRFITLPVSVISELGLVYIGHTEALVANQEAKELACYRGTIDWDGRPISVPILAVEGMPLLGMALFRDYHLGIDCIEGGNVALSRID